MSRPEVLTADEQAHQADLERSWAVAQAALADPAMRKRLEETIERLNRSDARPVTKAEFLAQTDPDRSCRSVT